MTPSPLKGPLLLVLLALLLAPISANSEQEKKAITPSSSASGEEDAIEEEITIRKSGKNLVEEYRINGVLYKVKVTPIVGPPYFLIDTDGDGFMDSKHGLENDLPVPNWVLFSW